MSDILLNYIFSFGICINIFAAAIGYDESSIIFMGSAVVLVIGWIKHLRK